MGRTDELRPGDLYLHTRGGRLFKITTWDGGQWLPSCKLDEI
jgi:hypothetical protein